VGRQVEFHALADDIKSFVDFVRTHDDVLVTLKDADRPEVEPISDPSAETSVLTLWNRTLLPSLKRDLVKRENGGDYYRIDPFLPTLELSPSLAVQWDGEPALLSGRVYGFSFDDTTSEYDRWYKAVAGWIRSHFVSSPLKLLGGYVGPAAFSWFKSGGILLPSFDPPRTADWLSFVEAQRKVRANATAKRL
jgi:hypothetical protein